MLLPEPVMSNPTTSKPLLHIPYTYIMVTTFIFPVFSLVSVVTLGVLLHFEKVTSTHCKVSHATTTAADLIQYLTCPQIHSESQLFNVSCYY